MTRDSTIDQQLAADLQSLRKQLTAALASVDELERQFVTPAGSDATQPEPAPANQTPAGDSPVRTDLLIHNITSPAQARSAQAQLASQPGVMQAEVRELAEGMVRITVVGDAPLTAAALAGWEPQRERQLRSEHPGVLEIGLGDPVGSSSTPDQ